MDELKTTCLHGFHQELGAKMSPFAGFDMPIEYEGIEAEHNAVRHHSGVFDVSHMGEVRVEGADATAFVNHIFTNDVGALADGQIAYGMLTNFEGGVVDDLLVYRVSENEYFLVINAANIAKDEQWILDRMNEFPGEDLSVSLESECWSELALQGPEAEAQLQKLFPDIDFKTLEFYHFFELEVQGKDEEGDVYFPLIVSRTGYTGEDGFELYADEPVIIELWKQLLENGVTPCGLGCRDTLRFEAGLPLYGDELDEDITPLEAGLGMFVKLDKADFVGRDRLAAQKAEGVSRKIVGLEVEGMAIPRHGYEVIDAATQEVVGHVTTGYRSITLGKNMAMAMVDAAHAPLGTEVLVRVRRKVFPAKVIKKRFYTPNYKK